MRINRYTSMMEALNALKKQGFTSEFKLENQGMRCLETDRVYQPADMRIAEYHRFEGDSSTDDSSVVYAVQCGDGAKGVIVSPHGMYADMKLVVFLDKVKILDRNQPEAVQSAAEEASGSQLQH